MAAPHSQHQSQRIHVLVVVVILLPLSYSGAGCERLPQLVGHMSRIQCIPPSQNLEEVYPDAP